MIGPILSPTELKERFPLQYGNWRDSKVYRDHISRPSYMIFPEYHMVAYGTAYDQCPSYSYWIVPGTIVEEMM